MIYLNWNLVLYWPTKKRTDYYPYKDITLFYWDKPISKNKAFSIQLDGPGNGRFSVFELEISWVLYQDHSGPVLHVGLLGFVLMLNLYDQRHWDSKTGDWETPENATH